MYISAVFCFSVVFFGREDGVVWLSLGRLLVLIPQRQNRKCRLVCLDHRGVFLSPLAFQRSKFGRFLRTEIYSLYGLQLIPAQTAAWGKQQASQGITTELKKMSTRTRNSKRVKQKQPKTTKAPPTKKRRTEPVVEEEATPNPPARSPPQRRRRRAGRSRKRAGRRQVRDVDRHFHQRRDRRAE